MIYFREKNIISDETRYLNFEIISLGWIKMKNGDAHHSCIVSGSIGVFRRSISFIIPLSSRAPFMIEYVNLLLKFAKDYGGFCELIFIDDGTDGKILKIIWILTELFRRNNTWIRVKMVRQTASLGLFESIRTGINMSMGEKIIVIGSDLNDSRDKKALKRMLSKIEIFSLAEIFFFSNLPSITTLLKIINQ